MNPKLVELAKKLEGFKDRIYICPAGFETIGYGHNCVAHDDLEYYSNLEPISEPLGARVLVEDLEESEQDCANSIRSFSTLDEVRQGVLILMASNMGVHKVMGFFRMLSAIEHSNWKDASREIYESKMARQTDREGPLMFMMLTGEWF